VHGFVVYRLLFCWIEWDFVLVNALMSQSKTIPRAEGQKGLQLKGEETRRRLSYLKSV
jgi:signal recognition particle subunit SRP68